MLNRATGWAYRIGVDSGASCSNKSGCFSHCPGSTSDLYIFWGNSSCPCSPVFRQTPFLGGLLFRGSLGMTGVVWGILKWLSWTHKRSLFRWFSIKYTYLLIRKPPASTLSIIFCKAPKSFSCVPLSHFRIPHTTCKDTPSAKPSLLNNKISLLEEEKCTCSQYSPRKCLILISILLINEKYIFLISWDLLY